MSELVRNGNFSSGEIWKDIPGYSNYQVSNKGNVRSKNYRRMGICKNLVFGYCGDYYNVKLRKNSKSHTLLVHRLVIYAFVGTNKNLEVNHKNGIKKDNRIENLEYCTRSENQKHSFVIGLKSTVGERHPGSILTEQRVLDIRAKASKMIADNGKYWGCVQLAKEYGVSDSAIRSIVKNKTWKHI